MFRIAFTAALLALLPWLHAEPEPLWPAGAPGAKGTAPADIPTLTFYAPAEGKANGATILVLPGGGYARLARHEGEGYARWFANNGFAAYVLAYRLGGAAGYRHPAMWDDASRALRQVRAIARSQGRDPAKVGVIGSSAGGHLAATLLTGFDAGRPESADPVERESSRPDFGVLCYPVISLVAPHGHMGSRNNLLGPAPVAGLAESLSAESRVTADTPPCFVWHATDDKTVPVENALLFAGALRRAGVPFELHLFERGGHGAGLPATNKNAPPWDSLLLRWLAQHAVIPAQ